jgi:hypothetical protein
MRIDAAWNLSPMLATPAVRPVNPVTTIEQDNTGAPSVISLDDFYGPSAVLSIQNHESGFPLTYTPEQENRNLGFAHLQIPRAMDDSLPTSILSAVEREARAAYSAFSGVTQNPESDGEEAAKAMFSAGLEFHGALAMRGLGECQTCSNRSYVDGSNDASVSFQTPTNIHPSVALTAVAAHEGEHIANERIRASQEGRRVVMQSVSIHTSVCPECGITYVAGGEARTVTAADDTEYNELEFGEAEAEPVGPAEAE